MNTDYDPTERKPWIQTVMQRLEPGDRVTVATTGGKTRTLTVTVGPRIEDRRPYRCHGLLVTCEGYGTEYTLECPSDAERPVGLLYPSSPSYGEFVRNLECDDQDLPIVSDTTVDDLLAEVR